MNDLIIGLWVEAKEVLGKLTGTYALVYVYDKSQNFRSRY